MKRMIQETKLFQKYFTVAEAYALIPFVQATFETAYKQLAGLKDEVVLYKRMHQICEAEDAPNDDPNVCAVVTMLHHKWHTYEECFHHWVETLTEKGIQVRDFKRGLIDFPYRDQNGQEYFLCWHVGEDALCYFHDIYEGFSGRRPISQLPD